MSASTCQRGATPSSRLRGKLCGISSTAMQAEMLTEMLTGSPCIRLECLLHGAVNGPTGDRVSPYAFVPART